MNGDRPPGHTPHRSPRPHPRPTRQRTTGAPGADAEEPGGHNEPGGPRRLVAVHHGGQGRFELAVSPGARIPELVAAAAVLPRSVVYTGHRAAAPGGHATILAFQAPPASPALVLLPPSPHGGGPPPLAARAGALEVVVEIVSAQPGWVPDAAAARVGGPRTAVEAALAVLITPAAFGLHGRLLVHGLAHCDPDALVEAADLARRRRAA